MEITLSKVVEAARQRRAAVTAEGGGYIVLLALQQLASSPREVTAELVGLTGAGDIELDPSSPAQAREVEAQLRQLLAALLALAQSAPPALKAAGERAALGDLGAFEAELSAALIPLNHAAARRALARLFRETQKATRGASSAPREASSAPASAGSELGLEAPPPSSRSSLPSVPQPAAPAAMQVRTIVAVAPLFATPPLPAAAHMPALSPQAPGVALPAPAALDIDVDVEVANSVAAAEVVSEWLPTSDAAAQLEVDDIEDIELDELDELDELCTKEPTPSELRFTSLSSLPLIVTSEDDALAESPLPDCLPLAGYAELEPEPPPHRSDLRELLDGYLAHTRCEEHMTADLRRMIGLEPWRAPGPSLDRTELGR